MEFGTMTIKLLYFAWVREKIGKDHEVLDLPPGIATVAELIAWLRAQGPEYAEAFARPGVVRAAIDRKHVQPASPIAGAREIALFPPVTGG
jgi:sulfur-carrier protein